MPKRDQKSRKNVEKLMQIHLEYEKTVKIHWKWVKNAKNRWKITNNCWNFDENWLEIRKKLLQKIYQRSLKNVRNQAITNENMRTFVENL